MNACGGEVIKDDPNAGMGFGKFARWFHIYCLSLETEVTNIEYVKKLDFKCTFCSKGGGNFEIGLST